MTSARSRAAAPLAFLLALAGCGGGPSQPSPLPLGEPFELRAGARATLGDGVIVTFIKVESDSRCPLDAICVTAGQALVAVTLARRSDGPPSQPTLSVRIVSSGSQLLTIDGAIPPPWCDLAGTQADCVLSTAQGRSSATAGGYTIEMLRLAPHPRAATRIEHAEYVATFVVRAQ